MKTKDEIDKIKASLLYILVQFPDGIDFIKLFKIMYFAEKEHLINYGRSITRDSFHALKHGPVPSFTYKAIQVTQGKIKENQDLNEVAMSIIISGDKIFAKTNADKDELSISDMRCLDNAINKCKSIDSYTLSDISHEDSAWKDAYSRSQDDPEKNKITLIDIARSGNASIDIINKIRESELIKMAFS